MKLTILSLTLGAISAVSAQTSSSAPSLSGINIPSCASSCITQLPANCNGFDIGCICGSSDWITGLSCCVSKACSPADQQATITFAQGLCSTYQVTVPSAASCAGASSTSAPSSASSGATSSSATGGSSGSGSAASSSASAAATQSKNNAHGFGQYAGSGIGLAAAGLIAAVL